MTNPSQTTVANVSIILLGTLVTLAVISFSLWQPWVPEQQLYRDVQVAVQRARPGEFLPLMGFVSNLGIMLWVSALSISFFSFMVLRYRKRGIFERSLLLSAFVLSGMFAFDDFFMMHELIYPTLLSLDEFHVFAFYSVMLVVFTLVFFRLLSRMGVIAYFIAVLLFGAAAVADLFWHSTGILQRLAEDGLKFAGIVFWSLATAQVCYLLVCSKVRDLAIKELN